MVDTWNTAVTEIKPNSVRVRGYDSEGGRFVAEGERAL